MRNVFPSSSTNKAGSVTDSERPLERVPNGFARGVSSGVTWFITAADKQIAGTLASGITAICPLAGVRLHS